jgi:hypothetical protein
MIGRGDLDDTKLDFGFSKGSILVLCNLRPTINGKTDIRPDILVLSSAGDVFLVEHKIRNKGEDTEKKAVSKLAGAAKQLAYYAERLRDFAVESQDNPWESWMNVYQNVYVRRHQFPPFNKIISTAFSFSNVSEQKKWIKRINNSFIKGNVNYGLAFNDLNDGENKGYQDINDDSLVKAIKGWKYHLGSLAFIGVNHVKDTFFIGLTATPINRKKKTEN